jgi:hypothetical protein
METDPQIEYPKNPVIKKNINLYTQSHSLRIQSPNRANGVMPACFHYFSLAYLVCFSWSTFFTLFLHLITRFPPLIFLAIFLW